MENKIIAVNAKTWSDNMSDETLTVLSASKQFIPPTYLGKRQLGSATYGLTDEQKELHKSGVLVNREDRSTIYDKNVSIKWDTFNTELDSLVGEYQLVMSDSAKSEKLGNDIVNMLQPWVRKVITSNYSLWRAYLILSDKESFRCELEPILMEKIAKCLCLYREDKGHFYGLLNSSLKGLLNLYMHEIGLGKKQKVVKYAVNSNIDAIQDRHDMQSITDWILSLDATDRMMLEKLKNIGKKTGRKHYGVNYLWKEHFNTMTRDDFRFRYDRLQAEYSSISA